MPWYKHISTIRKNYEQEIKKLSEEDLFELSEELKFKIEHDNTKILIPAVSFFANIVFTILFSTVTIYWGFANSFINSLNSMLIDKSKINTPTFKTEIKDMTNNQFDRIFSDVVPSGILLLGLALFVFIVTSRCMNCFVNSKNYLYKYFINFISDELKQRGEIKDIVTVLESKEKDIVTDNVESKINNSSKRNKRKKQKAQKRKQ
jgi:hypothetical protein